MSAIDINIDIPVTGSTEQLSQPSGIFAGCCLTRNVLILTTSKIKKFTSLANVGLFFGTASEEYKQASIYFKASTASPQKPPYIYFGRYIDAVYAPYVRSQTFKNVISLLPAIKLITAGSITITIDATDYVTSTINLSSATSISNACSLIQAAVVAAHATLTTLSLTFNTTLNNFTLTSGETGVSATMGYCADSNIATLLGLTQATAAYLSQGVDALTPTENMVSLSNDWQDTANFWAIDNLGDTTTDTQVEIAKFANDRNDSCAYLISSSDSAMVSDNDTTSIFYILSSLGYKNTAVQYEASGVKISPFIAGLFAAADYTQDNSAITAAFKSQDGLPYSISITAEAQILTDKGVNYYGIYKLTGGAAQFTFLQPGKILGEWQYLDNLMAQIYLARNLQLQLASYFTTVTEVTNDTNGQSSVRGIMVSVLEQCIDNKIISKGQIFDKTVQQELQTNYGISTTELTNNGYLIQVNAATTLERQTRTSPPWWIFYVKGSAIQKLPIYTVQMQ